MAEDKGNIEEFVKKAVDNFQEQDFPFNEEHWKGLEKMLDVEMPVAPSAGNGYYHGSNVVSVLTGIILLAAALWNANIQEQNQIITTQSTEIRSSPETPEASVLAESSLGEDQIAGEVQPSNTIESPSQSQAISEPAALEGQEKEDVVVEGSIPVPESADQQEAITGAEPQQSLRSVIADRGSSQTVLEEEPETPQRSQPDENEGTKPFATTEEDDRNDSSNDIISQSRTYVAMESLQAKSIDGQDFNSVALPGSIEQQGNSNIPESVEATIAAMESSVYPRFALSVVISPDLSSNDLFQYNRFGTEVGLLLEYRFTKRFSVEGGTLLTRKRYLTDAENYESPPGFWAEQTGGVLPSKVDASCQVLDIPLNLRYRVFENDIQSFSASVGISSYLMLKEDYDFTMPWGEWFWGTSGTNRHFFGVGNLQVHYERKLGKQFALEVAPFLKLPLTGYGHGNIRFHSLGAFFGVKRYFGFRAGKQR